MVKNIIDTLNSAMQNQDILNAADILNITVDQLVANGAARLYEGINNARREYQRLAALRDELDKAHAYETLCASYGELGKEELAEAHAARREVDKAIWQLQAAMADKLALGRAVKALKAIADPATLAVMKCRDRQYSVIANNERTLPEGARAITPQPKVKLGNYKLMGFEADETLKAFLPTAMKAIDLAESGDAPGACEVIAALEDQIATLLETGNPIQLNACNAKVNMAKQSLAAEIAGIEFTGKTTAKIISVSHNVKALLGENRKLAKALGPNGQNRMDTIEQAILQVMCRNGFMVTLPTGKNVFYDVWAATASQQKVGGLYAGEHHMMQRTAEVRNLGVTLAEFAQIGDNGPEMLKRQAVLFTPSAPMFDSDGNPVTLNDITMCKAIETEKAFHNILMIDTNGNFTIKKEGKLARNLIDGQMLFIGKRFIGMNAQVRALVEKAFGVCVYGMKEEIARREGWEIPEYIPDKWYLGGPRKVSEVEILATMDTCKWGKIGKDWNGIVAKANEFAKQYPTITQLRIARLADATEETGRRMARQGVQQLFPASDAMLDALAKKPIAKLAKFQKASNALAQFTNLDKEDRSALDELFERVPGLIASNQIQTVIENSFHDKLANFCASRVPVDGIYPYITEDPVVTLKVLIWGCDPNQLGLGYLQNGQINIPNAEEGKEMFAIRYPANLFTGMVFRNHNDSIYETCGNTAILPADDECLIRADGDVDGDEMALIFNKIVICMFRKLQHSGIHMPLVDFPHDKAKKLFMNRPEEFRDEMARALFVANKFGGAVGENSLLATRWFNKAAIAWADGNRAGVSNCLVNAMWAYVGSVLAIDMVKTGFMPGWLTSKLKAVKKAAGNLPWNQRFVKHTVETPWFDTTIWDDPETPYTEKESSSVCDRLARTILNGADAENYHFDTEGLEFDVNVLLAHDVKDSWTKGVLDPRVIAGIDARNFRKDANDSKLLRDIHNGERVSAKDLMIFFWRNSAALMRRLGEKRADKVEQANVMNDYTAFVRNVMISFGDSPAMQKHTPDERRKIIVNTFIKDAFEVTNGNGIGKDLKNKRRVVQAKGSYAKFELSVFDKDVLANAEENLGVPESERFATRHATPEAELVF